MTTLFSSTQSIYETVREIKRKNFVGSNCFQFMTTLFQASKHNWSICFEKNPRFSESVICHDVAMLRDIVRPIHPPRHSCRLHIGMPLLSCARFPPRVRTRRGLPRERFKGPHLARLLPVQVPCGDMRRARNACALTSFLLKHHNCVS